MKKIRTPLNLHVIAMKIIDHTGLYVVSDRKKKYDLLNKYLEELLVHLKPFVWLNMNSIPDIDYRKTVPIMADMIEWINDFKIEEKLHYWHYQEHNNSERLDELIELSKDFLYFIKKELDIKNDDNNNATE